MAADNTGARGSWTMERILQVGAPFALLAGVTLLILVQLVSTPRDRGQVERVEEQAVPTAAVRLSMPTVPSATFLTGSEAQAGPAPAAVPVPTVGQAEAPTANTGIEVLPTIESVNCQAPVSAGEQAACSAQSAPTEAPQTAPGSAGQGLRRTASGASAPVVSELTPISNLQPIPTSAVYSCAEVTSPIVNCRGARP